MKEQTLLTKWIKASFELSCRSFGAKLFGLAIYLFALTPASAGILITIIEDGDDVFLTYSGTLDLDGFNPTTPNQFGANTYLSPGAGVVYNEIANMDRYTNVLPSLFEYGTGISTSGGPSSRSGNFSLLGTGFNVPAGFTSGTLSGEMRWTNKSLADVQVTDGYDATQYLTGSTTEFITFKTGIAAVPEPSSLVLCAFAATGLLRRRRK